MIKRLFFVVCWIFMGILLGYCVNGFMHSRDRSNIVTIAMGTIQGLSRAIEEIKKKDGAYPDTIKGLDGSSYAKENYSKEIASRAFYMKTSGGYILVSGAPVAIVTDQRGWIGELSAFTPLKEGSEVQRESEDIITMAEYFTMLKTRKMKYITTDDQSTFALDELTGHKYRIINVSAQGK